MATLDNVATTDAYTPATTLEFPPTKAITAQVFGATAYCQLQIVRAEEVVGAALGGTWTEDKLLAPGFWTFTSAQDFRGGICTGVRWRSGATGTPARVICTD